MPKMANEAQFPETAAARSAKDEKRDAIVAIAEETFSANGYAGTSMSTIAARLGGSKGTLYNYFKSKDELFIAVIDKKCGQIQVLMSEAEIESGGDLRAALTRFGRQFLELILRDDSIAMYRLTTAESGRFPEIGKALYESGIQRNLARMSDLLDRAKEAGRLRADTDTSVAADQFIDLCLTGVHRRKLWNITPRPSRDEIERNVDNAVVTFMRAFGA
jgi:TetR/AcrR family transcriptional repressor of mexJK operon